MPDRRNTSSAWPDAEKAACFSAATTTGSLLFIAGTISVDDQFKPLHLNDMSAQTTRIYEIIGAMLERHGVGFDAVMKETIFVTDLEAFAEANKARAKIYAGTCPPAAAAVQVSKLWYPGIMIEIEAIADLSNGRK